MPFFYFKVQYIYIYIYIVILYEFISFYALSILYYTIFITREMSYIALFPKQWNSMHAVKK